jgi:hypothetical protein
MQITQEELQQKLTLHLKWLSGEEGGVRADLSKADLSNADLSNADLSNANLSNANLSYANLSNANLCNANLSYANLSNADLSNANLWNADLSNADLSNADLLNTNLSKAKNTEAAIARVSICPEGEIIGWKACKNNVIVKLLIPKESKRGNATGRKCRAEYVKVLEVLGAEVGITNEHGPKTEYKIGEIVKADSWDENRFKECSHGIHFFLTRIEAEDY